MRLKCSNVDHPPLLPNNNKHYGALIRVPRWRCPKCGENVYSELAHNIQGVYWNAKPEDTYETVSDRALRSSR